MSIWQPQEGGERFVRPPRSPLGDHFAARRVLERRRPAGCRRVCWFGESAAAGYLYAPHLTPAGRLEQILRAADGGAERWEVVDLARTDERLGSLVATVEAARQLEPDLLAIYAGNNWPLLETPEVSPYPPSVTGRQRAAAALAQSGPAGLAGLGRRTLHQRATAALDRIAELDVPVVLVLPEVNLADWESRQPVIWLPGDGSRRWWRLHAQALDALQRDDPDQAERCAWEMTRLDGSTGPVPFRLLARAWALRGDDDAVRNALQAEVDAVRYPLLAFLDSPRATTDARTLLADTAHRHGWTTVDLSRVFARHTGGETPGRRLFLDYCHLSSEGIDVATAAIAERVLELSHQDSITQKAAEAPRRDLSDSLVTPEAEATARLGAAIHTAHRMLPVPSRQDLLEHWCRTALDTAPSVADAFVDLADARTADLPALATAAQARSFAGPHTLELQHGWRWDGLDAPVLDAMVTALDEVDDPRAGEIRRLVVERAALRPGERRQLVCPRFRAEPLERFYPEVQNLAGLPGRATDRHPWPESSYLLVTDGATAVRLRSTVRLPAIPGAPERQGTVRLALDGREVGQQKIGEGWSRLEVELSASALATGLHRVTLGWPELPAAGDAALAAILRRLDEGVEADLHPVFGEVASLVATAV